MLHANFLPFFRNARFTQEVRVPTQQAVPIGSRSLGDILRTLPTAYAFGGLPVSSELFGWRSAGVCGGCLWPGRVALLRGLQGGYAVEERQGAMLSAADAFNQGSFEGSAAAKAIPETAAEDAAKLGKIGER